MINSILIAVWIGVLVATAVKTYKFINWLVSPWTYYVLKAKAKKAWEWLITYPQFLLWKRNRLPVLKERMRQGDGKSTDAMWALAERLQYTDHTR